MKEKIITIIACLLIFIGASVFCYPYVMNGYYNYQADKVLSSYKDEMEDFSKEMADEESHALGEADRQSRKDEQESYDKSSKRLKDLYEEMLIYNHKIFENDQEELADPFSFESASFDLTKYGLSDNLIGYLTIPVMDVELPVYLGATTENLAKGVAHLGQTSMPVGGANTNVVLAAHRGYRGIPMFREIEKIKVGDVVTFTTSFDTLHYEVTGIEIILPEEIDKIRIQPGKDMLTLFTCHPYRENTHRYVVFCERTTENKQKQENAKDAKEQISTMEETGEEEIYQEEIAADDSSQGQILLDRYVPIAGILFLVIVFILCFIGIKKKRL